MNICPLCGFEMNKYDSKCICGYNTVDNNKEHNFTDCIVASANIHEDNIRSSNKPSTIITSPSNIVLVLFIINKLLNIHGVDKLIPDEIVATLSIIYFILGCTYLVKVRNAFISNNNTKINTATLIKIAFNCFCTFTALLYIVLFEI
jgi:hypothetical protein